MIRLDRACVTKNGTPILRDVSLELAAGQVHAVVGASGSGKSTLLRLLAGLEAGSLVSGSAIVDGERSTTVGYVIQEGGLFPHLTLKQNVLLPARVTGMSEQHDLAFQNLMGTFGLESSLWTRYPHELSGGQRQRAAFARALLLHPKLLLLDEPLGAVDPLLRGDLQSDLQRLFQGTLKAERQTIVLVTHDLAEAGFLADSLTLLEQGRIVEHGPCRASLEKPQSSLLKRFVASYRALPVAS